MPRKLTVGSLFAGIGGFDLGLERAGFEIRFQVEIDPFCRKVLTKHWPHVPKYEDVREVGAHNLERVDLLCGGFPCQDISLAGPGAGLAGKRSGLWFQFDRLIGELRPGVVLVENVAALLGRGIGRVLGDLASRGYDAEWDCVPVSAISAPHRRDRVWIVAHANGLGSDRASAPAGAAHHEERHDSPYREERRAIRSQAQPSREDVSDADRAGLQSRPKPNGANGQHGWRVPPASDWWTVEPNVGRVAHGVPAQLRQMATHLAYVRGYSCDQVYSAADFLCAPRREPEGE